MRADFLFVGLNLNTNVQEKTPETCMFQGWCFENKDHEVSKIEWRCLKFPKI